MRAGLYRYSLAEFMIFSSATGAWIVRTISKAVSLEAEKLTDWKHFFLVVLGAGIGVTGLAVRRRPL
jgi:hypothetical protein